MSRGRRPLSLREAVAALVLVIGAGAIVLAVSPVHRAFYFGRADAGVARVAARRLSHVAPVPALPAVPGLRRGAAPVANVVTTKRPALIVDSEGRLRIPLSDQLPSRLPAAVVPAGWEAWPFTGAPDVELLRDEPGVVVRMRADDSSFAIYRDVVVDLDELPVLTWAWKAVRLPPGADVRQHATDDQAAQVYVVFPRWPAPRTHSDVIGYVWDTTAPVGTTLISTRASNMRIIVIESGAVNLGAWLRYTRDVRGDYQTLFGRNPPRVGAIALMIDSNDSHSRAESLVADLAFQRSSAGAQKTPTSMLR